VALAVLYSRALAGMDAPPVTVEVHLANGLPSFAIVGLPEAEVREARDRVRAALQNARFEFPARHITVNLAPADLPKESGRFDLPIALGILVATGQIPAEGLERFEFAGELALAGELRPVRGALAMSLGTRAAGRAFVLPRENAAEAALVDGATVYAAGNLLEVCAHFAKREPLARCTAVPPPATIVYADMRDVRGQAHAKRALEIAAAGAHSLLMMGPPGAGKTMLATRLPGILPAMTQQEALESAAVQSLGSQGFRLSAWRQRPYRAPHHTASAVALVGGGSDPRPGEISMAMHGVLFLDELPEFERHVLEVLREPLESGRVSVSRAARQAEFPAEFQLVGAMNPCPCGYLGHYTNRCCCTPDQIARYRSRISGPLLDRIDIQIEVPAVTVDDLSRAQTGESSQTIRDRVERARANMTARQEKPNAKLTSAELDRHCALGKDAAAVLQKAIAKLGLSARGYHRILKVARTIADLAGAKHIEAAHLAEAIQYRKLDRSQR
jgi:magnesium chelatase family protein